MRPKLTVILALVFLAIATSGYLLVKSTSCRAICNKCEGQPKGSGDSSGGGDGLNESGFTHFIVSTLR